MQLYDSMVVRFADLYQNATGDSSRALRWLTAHADKANPAAVIEAAINMADRETGEVIRERFLEIFTQKEKAIAVENPLMADYFIFKASDYSSALRNAARGVWESIHPMQAIPPWLEAPSF